MKSVVIIPARYKSSRFPGKPLAKINGKPMILWVAELCTKAVKKSDVYIATDSPSIAKVVESAGFNCVMTGSGCLTGTDRVAEAARSIEADIYINVQGDEPLLDPGDIKRILDVKNNDPDAVVNGYCALEEFEDPNDVNIPKVIFNESESLVYMSRKSLPGFKEGASKPRVFHKQVCIYAFGKKDLERFLQFGRKSALEASEDIEILRFLEWGARIKMVETSGGTVAVDVPEDVIKVEKILNETSG